MGGRTLLPCSRARAIFAFSFSLALSLFFPSLASLASLLQVSEHASVPVSAAWCVLRQKYQFNAFRNICAGSEQLLGPTDHQLCEPTQATATLQSQTLLPSYAAVADRTDRAY